MSRTLGAGNPLKSITPNVNGGIIMAKTTMNVAMRNNQQQISKILCSQLVSGVKNLAEHCDDDAKIKDSVEYKIATSRAHRVGCIAGWSSCDFAFDFEYGRRNAVRVSYVNSDGMISAVFSERQWIMLTGFIQGKLDRIIADKLIELSTKKRKEEEAAFQRRVEYAVREALEKEHTCNCKRSEKPEMTE